MSGLFDNRSDNTNRREERDRREEQARKKSKRISATVFAVFALVLAAAMFINSKFVRRSPAAVTIGGVGFSAVEYDYYFSRTYSNYASNVSEQFGEYASAFGLLPEQGTRLSEQVQDYETGETWADFFYDATIRELSGMVQIYNASQEAGYTLPEDDRQAIEDEISFFKMYAQQSGYTFDGFFYSNFGVFNMNEDSYRGILTFMVTISSYRNHVSESFVFSDEEKSEYYAEHKDSFDNVVFRLFSILPEYVFIENYEEDEEYEAALAAARAESSHKAERIVRDIRGEDEFIAAARQFDGFMYSDPDSTLVTGYPGGWIMAASTPEVANWLMDTGRKYGDCTSIDTEDSSFVLFFVDRDSNEYNLAEMRQILVLREEVIYNDFDEEVEDPEAEYIEAFEAADQTARELAEEAVAIFIEDGASEDSLIALIVEYSDDFTEGGFYGNIQKGQMVPEIDEWLFAPERQAGDYELIRTEAYGYHFVFYVGAGDRYCDYLAIEGMLDMNQGYKIVDGLREIESQAWGDTLEPVESETTWAFFFTQNT